MRSIGVSELLVLFATFVVVILLPGAAMVAGVWFFIKRGRQQPGAVSRTCPSCGQRVPDLGSYCLFCGQKIA
jgi:hypothetical protein